MRQIFKTLAIFCPICFFLPGMANPASGPAPSDYKDDTTYLKIKNLDRNIETFDPVSFARSVELLTDLTFKRGAYLLAAPEGQRVVERILDFGYPSTNLAPVWDVAQWSSGHTFSETDATTGSDGDRSYANDAKRITVYPDGGFTLEINGYTEYGDTPRKNGEPWPHLYLCQTIGSRDETRISPNTCKHIYFMLDAKREFCRNYMGDDYDPGIHTVHLVLTLTVQVLNPDSPFHGKYLNVQLPVYDYRYDFPPASYEMDKGKPTTTEMFIYGEAGDKVWDGTFKDGKWHRARLDILPILDTAIRKWTQKGGSFAGIDKNDLYISSFIMGWECEGTFHACMHFRNLSLRAVQTE